MSNILRAAMAICLLLCGVTGYGQTISGYEYWFDEDFAGKISVNVSGGSTYNINASINASSLSQGYHSFNYRTRSSDGKWSVPVRSYFVNGQNDIVGFEYWFDGDYSTKLYHALTPGFGGNFTGGINISGITTGNHSITISYIDNNDTRSAPFTSQFYYDGSVSGINDLSAGSIKAYPNPGDRELTLEGIRGYQELNITDVKGVIVMHRRLSADMEILDVSGLSPGIYSLVFVNKNSSGTIKWIKGK